MLRPYFLLIGLALFFSASSVSLDKFHFWTPAFARMTGYLANFLLHTKEEPKLSEWYKRL
jgi:hypothetical protein